MTIQRNTKEFIGEKRKERQNNEIHNYSMEEKRKERQNKEIHKNL